MQPNYFVNYSDVIFDIQTELDGCFDGIIIPLNNKIYIKFNNGQLFTVNVEEI